MRQLKRTGKLAALCCAAALGAAGALVSAGGGAPLAAHAEEPDGEWEQVSAILDAYPGVYTSTTRIATAWDTDMAPDGPQLGNGTVLAFMAEHDDAQNLHISRTDLWDGARYRTFGGLRFKATNTASPATEFRYEQDEKNAEISAWNTRGFKTVSYLSAAENLIVTEIENLRDEAIGMEVSAYTANANTASSVDGEVLVATKAAVTDTYNAGATSWAGWTVNAALAAKVVSGADNVIVSSSGSWATASFSIEPSGKAVLVAAVEGGKQDGTANTMDAATAAAKARVAARSNSEALAQAKQAHRDWWKDWWLASFIDIEDPLVERFYYGELYSLGCMTNASSENSAGLAVGLFPWTANNAPGWQGDYTLNGDVQRQLHPLTSANRTQGLESWLNVVKDFWPQAQALAADAASLNNLAGNGGRPHFTQGIADAAMFPVHIGPWGATTETWADRYWGQPAMASFALMPLIRWAQGTWDPDLLAELYPMVRDVAVFWENWVVLQNGKYVVYGATYENHRGKNTVLDVDAAEYILENAITAAGLLGLDEEKIPVWQNILDNMSPTPTFLYNGKEVVAEMDGLSQSATGNTFLPDNPVPLQSAYFFDAVGMGEPEEVKAKYVNWLDLRLAQVNHYRGLNAAVRVGYDIDKVFTALKNNILTVTPSNWYGLRGNNTAGDVALAANVSVVNDALLQGNEGYLNIFANWYNDQAASFTRLRANGGFVVSAAQNSRGKVTSASVLSEQGVDAAVLNPWEGYTLAVQDSAGDPVEVEKLYTNSIGTVYGFATEAGETYQLVRGELTEPTFALAEASLSLARGSVGELTVATNLDYEDDGIVWSSDNTGVALVGRGGSVTAVGAGVATITATHVGSGLSASCVVEVNSLPETLDVARYKTAWASSEHESFVASRAVQGVWDIGYEGWVSTHADFAAVPQRWIAVDLGRDYTIIRWVTGLHGLAAGKTTDWNYKDAENVGTYRLQVSPNGEDGWQDVAVKENPKGNAVSGFSIDLDEPVRGRYFRILVDYTNHLPDPNGWAGGYARVGQFELYAASAVLEFNVASVDPVAGVEVAAGTPFADLGLPSHVSVVLSTGNRANVPVEWDEDSYDGSAAGSSTVTGALTVAGLLANPDELTASVEVEVVGSAVEPLSLSPTAVARCAAGKAQVSVVVKNTDTVAAAVSFTTDFGSASFASVANGKSASKAFVIRATSVEAGTVTVTGETPDGAKAASHEVAYTGIDCAP
ncbi:MAG: Ig-like domain-containing protein [Bifidobacteriaceae bacterium]|jgi:hypothetical protein|nr:Ig-like domain-containing protein [Bifidobacteriaceae bacterium]